MNNFRLFRQSRKLNIDKSELVYYNKYRIKILSNGKYQIQIGRYIMKHRSLFQVEKWLYNNVNEVVQ